MRQPMIVSRRVLRATLLAVGSASIPAYVLGWTAAPAAAEPAMCSYPLKHDTPCAVYLGGVTYEQCAIHANLLVEELGELGFLYDDCEQNEYGSWDAIISDEPF